MKYNYQFYWKDWWRLWPSHSKEYDEDFNIYFNVRTFGPIQWSYWSSK